MLPAKDFRGSSSPPELGSLQVHTLLLAADLCWRTSDRLCGELPRWAAVERDDPRKTLLCPGGAPVLSPLAGSGCEKCPFSRDIACDPIASQVEDQQAHRGLRAVNHSFSTSAALAQIWVKMASREVPTPAVRPHRKQQPSPPQTNSTICGSGSCVFLQRNPEGASKAQGRHRATYQQRTRMHLGCRRAYSGLNIPRKSSNSTRPDVETGMLLTL